MEVWHILIIIIGLLALIGLIYLIVRSILKKRKAAAMDAIAKRKRADRNLAISQIKYPAINLSESKIQQILNSTVMELRSLLLKGELTSVELLVTFMKRATTIGVELECLAEFDWDESLVQAKKADEIYKNDPKKAHQLLLLGIPVSIKDNINMKGFDSTVGCADRCYKPSHHDGYMIKALRAEGAILFARSSMPQVGLTIETTNAVWGRAINPWNKARTTGGSTGGEGGLISSRCSPLGLGSDLGGSIRIPSAFCGIYGFKPTSGRLTISGHTYVAPALSGQKNLCLAIGPMGKSVDDLNLMMMAFLKEEFHMEHSKKEHGDFYNPFIKWNETLYHSNRRLKVGMLPTTQFMPATEPMQRAVREAAQALRSKGHEVVEVELSIFEDIVLLFLKVLSSEGGTQILFETAAGEKLIDEYETNITVGNMPRILKSILISLLRGSKPRLSKLMASSNKMSARELLELGVHQDELKEKFQRFWGLYGLDCLLLPPIATPAFRHGASKDITLVGCYSMLSNVLNLPAGSVPIGVVAEGETQYNGGHPDPISEKIAENMQESEGLPIAVQVLAATWDDELCLSVMRQIDEVIGFSRRYQLPL